MGSNVAKDKNLVFKWRKEQFQSMPQSSFIFYFWVPYKWKSTQPRAISGTKEKWNSIESSWSEKIIANLPVLKLLRPRLQKEHWWDELASSQVMSSLSFHSQKTQVRTQRPIKSTESLKLQFLWIDDHISFLLIM